MKNTTTEKPEPTTITLDLWAVRRMHPDALLCIFDDRLSMLRNHEGDEAEVKSPHGGNWTTKTSPGERFQRWTHTLTPEQFADFFDATTWPPPPPPKKPEPAKATSSSTSRPQSRSKNKNRPSKPGPRKAAPARRAAGPVKKLNAKPSKLNGKAPKASKGAPKMNGGAPEADPRQMILDFVQEHPHTKFGELREALKLTEGQAKGHIRRLMASGGLVMEGTKRAATYTAAQSNGAAAGASS